MAQLIRHGTWVIVPVGVAVAFLYLHVSAKFYPRSLARYDDARDGGHPQPPEE